jgi:hypothetical protein
MAVRLSALPVWYSFLLVFPKSTRSLEPISYRALLSTLLHATVYVYTQFANVLVQIASKRGLQKGNVCQWLSRPQDHSAAERIRLMKKKYLTGNGALDLWLAA